MYSCNDSLTITLSPNGKGSAQNSMQYEKFEKWGPIRRRIVS